MQPKQKLEVFLSYSHQDEKLCNELRKHLNILERQGIISAWHDRRINPGAEWKDEIDKHLEDARIVLLLISPDFIASDYCYDIEMVRAMERHFAGNLCVIPIILRPVDWQSSLFGQLQALPRNAKPVTSWDNQDEAFVNIATEIRLVAEKIRNDHVDAKNIQSQAINEKGAKSNQIVVEVQNSQQKRINKFEYRQVELNRQLEFLSSIKSTLQVHSSKYDIRPSGFDKEIDFLDENIGNLQNELSSWETGELGLKVQNPNLLRYPRRYFIGRKAKLQELLPLLGPLSLERFILLKGPAGVGKSALAFEAAYKALDLGFTDDILVLSIPDEMVVTNRLGIIDYLCASIKTHISGIEGAKKENGTEAIITEIKDLLLERRIITIVDDFENGIDTKDKIFEFFDKVIPHGCKVIFTSRQHFSEVDYILHIEGMSPEEASLLIRKEAYTKSLKSLAYADHKLLKRAWVWASGLPLAIQWLIGYASEAGISFERLLVQFEYGMGPDDELLNQLFKQSFDLVIQDDSQKKIILSLAILATHGNFDSISAISGVAEHDLERALGSLYRLSLVQFNEIEENYSLLAITRRFVMKHIENSIDLIPFYERAIVYYQKKIGDLDEVQIQSPDIWEYLNHERRNILAILDWCIASDRWETFIGIGLRMNSLLGYSGMYHDRLKYTNQLMQAADQLKKPDLKAWILVHEVGWINQHIGNYDAATDATKSGLDIANDIGDVNTVALANRNLGLILYRKAKREENEEIKASLFRESLEFGDRALKYYESINDLRWKAITLRLLGMVRVEMNELDLAQSLYEEALILHQKVKDYESESLTISDLGTLAFSKRDFYQARKLLEKALALDEKYNRSFGRARNRQRLAYIEFENNNTDKAKKLLKEALEIYQGMGATKAVDVLMQDALKMQIDI